MWAHLQRQRLLLPLRAFLLDVCRLLFAPLSPRLTLAALDLLLLDGPSAVLRLALALCKRHRARLLACVDLDSLQATLRAMVHNYQPQLDLNSALEPGPDPVHPECPCLASSTCAESSHASLSVSTANLLACLQSGLPPSGSALPSPHTSSQAATSTAPVTPTGGASVFIGSPCACRSQAPSSQVLSVVQDPPSVAASSLPAAQAHQSSQSAQTSQSGQALPCPCECCWVVDLVRSAYSDPRFQGIEQATLDQLRAAGVERCRKEADQRKRRRTRLEAFVRFVCSPSCLIPRPQTEFGIFLLTQQLSRLGQHHFGPSDRSSFSYQLRCSFGRSAQTLRLSSQCRLLTHPVTLSMLI